MGRRKFSNWRHILLHAWQFKKKLLIPGVFLYGLSSCVFGYEFQVVTKNYASNVLGFVCVALLGGALGVVAMILLGPAWEKSRRTLSQTAYERTIEIAFQEDPEIIKLQENLREKNGELSKIWIEKAKLERRLSNRREEVAIETNYKLKDLVNSSTAMNL